MAARSSPLLFPVGPVPWLKPAIVVGSLVPLATIGLRAATGALGANPIATVENQLGLLAIVMLTLSLSCTPWKIVTRQTWPIRVRKALGLLAFFYAMLHFATYVALDQGFSLARIDADIAKRLFILVGLGALVVLVPLAATSTAGMVKRLGHARWTRIHRLAYLAGLLAVVHFFLRVKKDVTEPAIYGALFALGLAIRAFGALRGERAKGGRTKK